MHLGHTRHRRAVTGGRRKGLGEALTLHLVEHPRHRSAQRIEVIAPFEHRGETPAGVLGGDPQQHPCQAAEPLVADPHARERVAEVGVESGRDQHELGIELAAHWVDHPHEGIQVLAVAAAGGQRHVEGKTLTVPDADLVDGAGAGVEGVLVRGDVEHSRVVRKAVLGSVSVVHVPIDDQHPIQSVPLA